VKQLAALTSCRSAPGASGENHQHELKLHEAADPAGRSLPGASGEPGTRAEACEATGSRNRRPIATPGIVSRKEITYKAIKARK